MNIARLEHALVVVSQPTGAPAYDFDLNLNFRCDHPHAFACEERCVLRLGAIPDYARCYEEMLELGLRPVNTPAQHALASDLGHWLPLIPDLTPRTEVFDSLPPAQVVAGRFGWPIFLKGSRQTSRHNGALSVIKDAEAYEAAAAAYARDEILHWQKPAIREFVHLHPVPGIVPGKIRPSLEYRSFWWNGRCVGWGRYWYQVPPYDCADAAAGLALAQYAARRLDVPFLVIDVARTVDGRWIVIECNDAQESGYAAIPPRPLWTRILHQVSRGAPDSSTAHGTS